LRLPDVELIASNSLLRGYSTFESYEKSLARGAEEKLYGLSLLEEVARYAKTAPLVALRHDFDIIHAHDWLTWQAGIRAAELTGKPVILHVHATEFDRCGGDNINSYVYQIEKDCLQRADVVVAVSQATKNQLVEKYGVNEDKVEVLHNGIYPRKSARQSIRGFKDKKLVIFMGRLTLQKGPDYFLQVAKRLLDVDPEIRFVIAGSGDMELKLIEQAAAMGIADKVLFAGFLRGAQKERLYASANVYVMPSVSEPFGIGALEAADHGTPVIVTKDAGVCEAFPHCLRVDFWDIDKMANKILSVLRYPEMAKAMSEEGRRFLPHLSWKNVANKCLNIYKRLVRGLSTKIIT